MSKLAEQATGTRAAQRDEKIFWPWQLCAVVRVLARALKGQGLDSQSRAHTKVAGSIPSQVWACVEGNQSICLSPSLLLPPPTPLPFYLESRKKYQVRINQKKKKNLLELVLCFKEH